MCMNVLKSAGEQGQSSTTAEANKQATTTVFAVPVHSNYLLFNVWRSKNGARNKENVWRKAALET